MVSTTLKTRGIWGPPTSAVRHSYKTQLVVTMWVCLFLKAPFFVGLPGSIKRETGSMLGGCPKKTNRSIQASYTHSKFFLHSCPPTSAAFCQGYSAAEDIVPRSLAMNFVGSPCRKPPVWFNSESFLIPSRKLD